MIYCLPPPLKVLSKYSVFGSVDNKLAFVERTGIWYVDSAGVDRTAETTIPLDRLVEMIGRDYNVVPCGIRF